MNFFWKSFEKRKPRNKSEVFTLIIRRKPYVFPIRIFTGGLLASDSPSPGRTDPEYKESYGDQSDDQGESYGILLLVGKLFHVPSVSLPQMTLY